MPKASAVVLVSAVSGVPVAAVVLTAIDVSGPAVARVSAVAAIPTYVDVPSDTGVSNVSGSRIFHISAVVGVPGVARVPAVSLLFMVLPSVLACC
jgi:hypothetical protein